MERFTFGSEVAFAPRQDILKGVTIAPLTPPIAAGSPVQCAIFRLGAGGRIGRHPALVPQIFAVLEGTGTIAGTDGVDEDIRAGEAVFWAEGEEHETSSTSGLTALVVEGPELRPVERRA